MGESGDPCGVLYEMGKGAETKFPMRRFAVRSVRKESIHRHMVLGNPFIRRMWAVHCGLRLSKNPEISKRRRAPAWPDARVAWMQWVRQAAASVTVWCR